MEIIDIKVEHIDMLRRFYARQRKYIPYYYGSDTKEFIKSFFVETIDNEQIYKDLITKAVVSHDEIVALIQYGMLTYDLNYDGEQNYEAVAGNIRVLHGTLSSYKQMEQLLSEALAYFKLQKAENVYAYEHAFGLKVFGRIGKLYKSEKLTRHLLKKHHFAVENTSILYSIDLKKNPVKQYDNGLHFVMEEQDGIYFFKIMKYLVEVGGLEFMIVDHGKRAYLNYFYILDEHQGHMFGKEAMNEFKYYLQSEGIRGIDSDVDKDNGLGQSFYEDCKFFKLGTCDSFVLKEKGDKKA